MLSLLLAASILVLSGSPPSATTTPMGLNTIAATADTWGADTTVIMRVQATATGTLSKAYIYVDNTAVVLAKVAVYGPDTDDTPNLEDAQIGITGTITADGSAGWQPAAGASISGAITSGSFYYLTIFLSASSPTWAVRTENTSAVGYLSAGHYASPPATFDSLSFGGGAYGRISAYVTIAP